MMVFKKIPEPVRREDGASFAKTVTLTSLAVGKTMGELAFDTFCRFR